MAAAAVEMFLPDIIAWLAPDLTDPDLGNLAKQAAMTNSVEALMGLPAFKFK